MKDYVFILKKENYSWYKVNIDKLGDWLKDGSINEEDLIVFPEKVKVAKKVVTIELEDWNEGDKE